jgi:hypothetical protein
MAARLLAGLILGAALAGCGDDDSPTSSGQGGVPDYATVKRLALATRPLNACRGGTEEADQGNTQGGQDLPQLAGGSKVLHCEAVSSPFVRYLVFKTEADRDKEVRALRLESAVSPFFVNGRTLVHVEEADPTAKPSPLAQQIKEECGCGDVR